ncbi:hypothetical protein RND81_12G064300, partial [Saponaria officinalis]
DPRTFKAKWFKNHESWLEYSTEKDAAFCFACYLFKRDNVVGGDAFVSKGYKTWSKTDSFDKHVGNHMSAHNNAMRDLDNFKKHESSIVSSLDNQSTITKTAYQTRLEASIKTIRFLLRQGMPFRGQDEKETSLNRENFVELIKLFAQHDEKISEVVLNNAPQHCILTSPKIQKDIVNACATETTKKSVKELNDGFFGILADESADIADKEQMTLCLRYVDKKGRGVLKERFFGIMHVGDTTSLTLKEAISQLLMKYSLTFSRVRGQGYDGASNMQGSINGLKTLILNESSSVYYVHCFAHQLQLILVATLTNLLNLVESLPKHDFKCAYFDPTILDVNDTIEGFSSGVDNVKAESLSYAMRRFDFVFIAQLMVTIFGVTNKLNLTLQRKEQDIVNAMRLVDVTNGSLQRMRDSGWDSRMEKVSAFCSKYDIDIPSMGDLYVILRRHGCGHREVTNLHHFRVEVFLSLIDQVLHEFKNRFDEVSKKLLVCMASFNPQNKFASFDIKKLLRLAKFYPSDERFWNLKSLNELSMKLVETRKRLTHSKVYLLLKLVLVLPVATATLERTFSAMTFVKNRLRNITFVERDVFLNVTDEEIVMNLIE